MKAKQFATALIELLKDAPKKEQETIIDGFFAYLSRNGYQKLLPAILHELGAAQDEAKESIVLTVAKEADAESIQTKDPNAKDAAVVVDENIIGGYTLETKNSFIDASYRGALVKLYQSLTH